MVEQGSQRGALASGQASEDLIHRLASRDLRRGKGVVAGRGQRDDARPPIGLVLESG